MASKACGYTWNTPTRVPTPQAPQEQGFEQSTNHTSKGKGIYV